MTSSPAVSELAAHVARCRRWVDAGIPLTRVPGPSEYYRRWLVLTAALRDEAVIDAAFFVHKPPGLRWRLLAAAGVEPAQLRDRVTETLNGLGAPTWLTYEPQTALFGGDAAMADVHATWSADSRAWARWHAGKTGGLGRWEMSFGILAQTLRHLQVVGWEDREVWDLIVHDTGRRTAESDRARSEVQDRARAIRAAWARVWPDATGPSPVADDFDDEAGPALQRWHGLCAAGATAYPLTPRAAAAYWTVFHWNRAATPATVQALTAETLAGRIGSPAG